MHLTNESSFVVLPSLPSARQACFALLVITLIPSEWLDDSMNDVQMDSLVFYEYNSMSTSNSLSVMEYQYKYKHPYVNSMST